MGEMKKKSRKRSSSKLMRWLNTEGRRFCAIALCVSLIMGNLAYVAIAADEEPDFRFELERQALSDALQEAIAKGEPVSSDFGFEGAEADMYKLSMPTDETLYELMPETAYNDGDLQLRIFVHLESSELINDLVPEGEIAQIEEITESHNSESTGSENIFFLLINKSDQAQTAVIRIDDKESEWILVEPYSAVEMPEQEGESGGPGVSGPGAAAENGSTSEQQPEVNSASGVITSGSENSGSSGGSSGGSSSGSGSSEKTEDESVTESESSPAVDEKLPAESESSPEVDEETSIEYESAGAEQPAEDDAGKETDTPEMGAPEIDVPETDAPSVDIPENNTPDIDVPETDEPEIHIEIDTPETDEPEIDMPESNVPETDESDVPEIEIPESDGPDDANDIEDTNDTEMDTSENSSEVEILDDSEDVNDISAESNDAENSDTTSSGSDKSDGHEGGDTAELSATVSIHKTCLVASSKASPSNATPSNATPSDATSSDAAKESLDGIIYDAVRMGNDSAKAFVTTLNDVGITVDGHFTECEDDCSGKECECGCHAVAHTLVADIEGLLAEVRTYDENTSTDIMFAAYDKLFGPLPDSIEKAYDNGELSDAEHAYVYEVFDASGMEIMEIFQKLGFDPYAVGTMDVNTVNGVDANGVTVKMFNYTNDANNEGLGLSGYNFFQGNYVKDDNDEDTKEGTVDGTGSIVSEQSDSFKKMNSPTMVRTLKNGYPYVDNADPDVEGSMDYLFDETYYKGTAVDGGGLFKKSTDGGYYYDSMENAAYFNESTGKFTLYNFVIRPKYTSADGSDVQRSNFLPFNEPTAISDETTLTDNNEKKAYALKNPVDLWFGMTAEFDFFMPEDGKVKNNSDDLVPMVFDFMGDDDVFVYIDDVLVLALEGTHAAEYASIDFNTGIVIEKNSSGEKTIETNLKEIFSSVGEDYYNEADFDGNTFADYTVHSFKFYYMERGGNISYCRLKFNMPPIPEGTINFQKELEYENVADAADIDFEFKAYVNYSGEDDAEYKLYTDAYEIYDASNLQNPIRQISAEENEKNNGIVKLKDNQVARLVNTGKEETSSTLITKASKFYIQEIGATSDKYDVTMEGVTITEIFEDSNEVKTQTGVETEKLVVNSNPHIVFKNSVVVNNQFDVIIKKKMSDGSTPTESFDFRLLLGTNETVYTGGYEVYDSENSMVGLVSSDKNADGIISCNANQYVKVTGLVGGNVVKVEEIDLNKKIYSIPTYDITGAIVSGSEEITEVYAKGIALEGIALNEAGGKITVTVTNKPKPDLTITKEVKGTLGDRSKQFEFEILIKDKEGGTVQEIDGDYGDVTIKNGKFTLKHEQSITIPKLPDGAWCEVKETDYTASGYTTTVEVGNKNISESHTGTISSLVETTTIKFTNSNNPVIDTGILLDSMPYVLILAAAAAGAAFYFIRRKKEDEDDLD